jgi:tetratricopeptide (TPR) repeat protein
MTSSVTPLCPQDEIEALAQSLSETEGVSDVDGALALYPSDHRLHFLRGSVLAGDRRYDEARESMRKAIDLVPDYSIARFQLGFLEFTSGEPAVAAATWTRLQDLPSDDPLRLFSEGLMLLVEDDASGAIERLRRGIELNDINPSLNRDMELLISELSNAQTSEAQPNSETQMLLRQFGDLPRQ